MHFILVFPFINKDVCIIFKGLEREIQEKRHPVNAISVLKVYGLEINFRK